MKIPFNKKKAEIWAVIVPEEKWTKAAMLLRDTFKKDHIVIDRIEDEDEKLKAQVSFYSEMNEYVQILVALDKSGVQVITEPEGEKEEKEVKKKK